VGGRPQVVPKSDARGAEKPDAKPILQQVILDLLTNPELRFAREFYGTPGGKKIALRTDSPIAWPKGFRPKIPGYDVCFQSGESWVLNFIYWHVPYGAEIYSCIQQRKPRLLGVSLNTQDLDPRRPFDNQICVTLFNIGGNCGQTPVIGGFSVYYKLNREKENWVVKFAGSFDP